MAPIPHVEWMESLKKQTEKSKDVLEVLIKVADNIINMPEKECYRQLKLNNTKVKELIKTPGASEALYAMGFKKDGEMLMMNIETSTNPVKEVRNQIKSLLDTRRTVNDTSMSSTASSSTADQHWHILEFPNYSPRVQIQETVFLRKLQSSFDSVLLYESPALQEKARKVIPTASLMEEAQANFTTAKSHGNVSSLSLDEFYIIALMNWFRDEFFRWVNKAPCQGCGGETRSVGSGDPTAEDLKYGATRVELYSCGVCNTTTRFPRYNDPGKLLETRRGRCGEWANCFTLLCRASGYEARYVLDWTDHVWTEVFSRTQDRWLHCDPGEKALDKPLLYERGWGKKLTYVIAFSKDDINDVSWRYSADHRALVSRRVECREPWLRQVLERLREQRQQHMNREEKLKHQKRLIKEFAEFISSKPRVSAGDMVGRLTGSEEWRRDRGELGQEEVQQGYSFTPTGEEKCGFMDVSYCCSTNQYTIVSEQGEEKMRDWKKGLYSYSSMFRNTEIDWNKVYLARDKGCKESTITWRFDLKERRLSGIELTVTSEVFESGQIKWTITGKKSDRTSITQDISANQDLGESILPQLKDCVAITLKAHLSGGTGDNAWQHTQLFRQSRDDKSDSMKITISFTS